MRKAAPSALNTFAGVPAGARMGKNSSKMKRGMPASTALGTFGRAGLRCAAATASARTPPWRICPIDEAMVGEPNWASPDIRAATAGPPPR